MFRSILLSTRRLLPPRPLTGPSIKVEAPATGSIAIYDIRRNGHISRDQSPTSTILQPSLLGQQRALTTQNHIRWASDQKSFQMPNPSVVVCNMINMLKCVDLNDLKDAPPPAFWTGLALGGLQLVVPLLEIIGGYSPVLTMYQLYSAAISVAFLGGQKWGLALSDNKEPKPNWDTMIASLAPPSVALLGLLMPYPVGFLMVGSSLLVALYLNLKACIYPPWACAVLVFTYLTTAIGLLLALSAYVLFNNSENKKKKNEPQQDDKKREEIYHDKEDTEDRDEKPKKK